MPIIAKLVAFSFSLSPYLLFSTFSLTTLTETAYKKKEKKKKKLEVACLGGREGEEIGTSYPKDVVVVCNQIKPTIYPINMYCYNLYIWDELHFTSKKFVAKWRMLFIERENHINSLDTNNYCLKINAFTLLLHLLFNLFIHDINSTII